MNVAGYLTVASAAQALAVSDQTIRRRIKEGLIPAVKFGRHWLINPDSLRVLLEGSLLDSL